MEDEKGYYSIKEFADLLRVHHNTIRKAIHKGRINALRIGPSNKSSYRIPATETNRLAMIERLVSNPITINGVPIYGEGN